MAGLGAGCAEARVASPKPVSEATNLDSSDSGCKATLIGNFSFALALSYPDEKILADEVRTLRVLI